jgi:regulator of sigma E protease
MMEPTLEVIVFTALRFLAVLGALIAVHEFGHFIVAKKSGVLVERFSIGFGPPFYSRKWGETEYRLSVIPLGGYVKMYGEDLDAEISENQRERSFQHQSVWKRIPIVAAGPAFNIIFAIALIAFVQVSGYPVEQSVHIGRVLEDSAAAEAGLQSDDKVISLNGQNIKRIRELRQQIVASEGRTLPMHVSREGREHRLLITPRKVEEVGEWRIGVELRPDDFVMQRADPLSAIARGCEWTWRITRLTFTGFGQIISGAIPVSESLAGPLGIAQEISRQADNGWRNVVFLTAAISVSLAILNLLPIPVLDGGHLLFFLIEIVQGGPLSARKREIAHQVGLVILVCLMLFAFYNDILRLFS